MTWKLCRWFELLRKRIPVKMNRNPLVHPRSLESPTITCWSLSPGEVQRQRAAPASGRLSGPALDPEEDHSGEAQQLVKHFGLFYMFHLINMSGVTAWKSLRHKSQGPGSNPPQDCSLQAPGSSFLGCTFEVFLV